MSDEQTETAILPEVAKPRLAPLWHVVLVDDDDHSYDYVIEMLGKLYHHNLQTAFRMAQEVDSAGRVIVQTMMLEPAEFKRDQVHAYGKDWRIERCAGSMSARLEPAAG